MDLVRHLRYFVTVADELHFGRAAERLHMSQPPLSQRVRALERRVGGPLFERTSRQVRLSPLGRRLLPEARALVEHADRVAVVVDELGATEAEELAVGVPEGLPAAVVAATVAVCRDRLPGVHVALVPGTPMALERDLLASTLHAALVEHPVPAPARAGPLLESPLGVLARGGETFGEQVEVFELTGRELVLPARNRAPARHDRLIADLRALGWVAPEVHAADGDGLVAGLVLASGAVAVVAPPAAPVEGLRWWPLAGEPLVLRASVAWMPGAATAQVAAEALTEALLEGGGWRRARGGARPVAQERPSSGLLS